MQSGLLLLSRGMAWKGLVLFVLGLASLGLLLLLHSLTYMDLVLLISGIGSFGLSLLVLETPAMEASLTPQSFPCFDVSLFALHAAVLGFFLSSQGPSSLASFLAICGCGRIDFLPLVLDVACFGALLSARGFVRNIGSTLPVLDVLHVGMLPSPQSLVKADLPFFAGGVRLSSATFALSSAMFGPFAPSQSSSHPESPSPATSMATSESSLSLRSLACLGSFLLVDSAVSVKVLSPFVMRFATPDVALSLQSLQWCGCVSVFDVTSFGFPLLLRSNHQMSLFLLVLGNVRPGTPLSVVSACFGSILLLHSFA